jgi:hypothetical protein
LQAASLTEQGIFKLSTVGTPNEFVDSTACEADVSVGDCFDFSLLLNGLGQSRGAYLLGALLSFDHMVLVYNLNSKQKLTSIAASVQVKAVSLDYGSHFCRSVQREEEAFQDDATSVSLLVLTTDRRQMSQSLSEVSQPEQKDICDGAIESVLQTFALLSSSTNAIMLDFGVRSTCAGISMGCYGSKCIYAPASERCYSNIAQMNSHCLGACLLVDFENKELRCLRISQPVLQLHNMLFDGTIFSDGDGSTTSGAFAFNSAWTAAVSAVGNLLNVKLKMLDSRRDASGAKVDDALYMRYQSVLDGICTMIESSIQVHPNENIAMIIVMLSLSILPSPVASRLLKVIRVVEEVNYLLHRRIVISIGSLCALLFSTLYTPLIYVFTLCFPH